jgi:hypothetical protein
MKDEVSTEFRALTTHAYTWPWLALLTGALLFTASVVNFLCFPRSFSNFKRKSKLVVITIFRVGHSRTPCFFRSKTDTYTGDVCLSTICHAFISHFCTKNEIKRYKFWLWWDNISNAKVKFYILFDIAHIWRTDGKFWVTAVRTAYLVTVPSMMYVHRFIKMWVCQG